MALVSTPRNSSVVIAQEVGKTTAGGPILRTKTLKNIKNTASEEAINEVVRALFGLSQYPIVDIALSRNFGLTEED